MHRRDTSFAAILRRQGARLGLAGIAGMALLGLQACSSSGGQVEHWRMVEGKAPQSTPAVTGSGSKPVAVVFYRDAVAGAQAQAPINVYINGQYQTSLVGQTYTQQSLCPGNHRMKAAREDVRRQYVSKEEGQTFAVGSEPIQYFRVSEGAGGVASIAPTPAQAVAANASLRQLQTHTVPRVVRNGCASS